MPRVAQFPLLLCFLDERVAGRIEFQAMQLGGEAVFVGRSGGDKAFAKLQNFFRARAAAANLRTAAGCGHEGSLVYLKITGLVLQQAAVAVWNP